MTVLGIDFLTGDNGTVWVRIRYRLRGTDGLLDFKHDVGHALAAATLRDALEQQRRDLIREIRAAEYEAGWRDKSRKRAKREWHSTSMERKASA